MKQLVATLWTTAVLVAACSGSSKPSLITFGHSYVAGGNGIVPWSSVAAKDMGRHLINHGSGGDLAADTLKRIKVQATGTDVVVVETGLNDLRLYGADPDHLAVFTAALDSILNRLKGERVFVVEEAPLGDWSLHPPYDHGSDALLGTYDQAIAAAAGRARDGVIDFRTGWVPETMIGPDHVHPNIVGATHLGALVAAAVNG